MKKTCQCLSARQPGARSSYWRPLSSRTLYPKSLSQQRNSGCCGKMESESLIPSECTQDSSGCTARIRLQTPPAKHCTTPRRLLKWFQRSCDKSRSAGQPASLSRKWACCDLANSCHQGISEQSLSTSLVLPRLCACELRHVQARTKSQTFFLEERL